MKQIKKALLAAVAALGVAGSAVQAQDATLRFSWWGGGERHESTLKAIQLFESKNPGIKVKAEYMGFAGYLERLTTQIAGGSEPDIMQINWAWLSMFSRNGDGLYDLNQQKASLALNQFSEEELKMGVVKGRLNALPVSYTARVFVWNKAAWDRAGLPLPTTWDQLFASGAAFKQKLGDKAYAIDGEAYDMLLLSHAYVQQKYGQPYIHPSEPKVAMTPQAALDWVKTYKRLSAEHTAVPLPLRASLGGAEKPTEQQPDWVSGNWAGNYTWDSVLRLRASTLNKDQKLDIGEFLMLPGAKASGVFGRPSLMFAVSKNSKHPAAAAKLLNFLLTDPEAARVLGLSRGVPASDSQFHTLVKENRIEPTELKAYLQIKKLKDAGQIQLPSPLLEHARVHKFLREVFESVSYNKVSDEDAARRLVEEGNSMLRRIR
ncbi:ABC transporter substrate-binding protein [Eleftheria terrae]|uniref:ABC transporter substrate-binding protein n=1 Tax=Eleftheria terrae TaxID=1597781 RepID=UPI00263B3DC6|nr:ABC transporter substrate-binding protein [Eleftheria terrae]WKB53806.1 ABC transporter substrate-binding protein [Eleftheria terrae]